ncbi:hypothetical protein K438DRAFT_1751387 [Mycena galopus ATCC 62051]|nr:hypothetical protein K438DRAFT_1751387 [Mycena galopus ATCC 62051]
MFLPPKQSLYLSMLLQKLSQPACLLWSKCCSKGISPHPNLQYAIEAQTSRFYWRPSSTNSRSIGGSKANMSNTDGIHKVATQSQDGPYHHAHRTLSGAPPVGQVPTQLGHVFQRTAPVIIGSASAVLIWLGNPHAAVITTKQEASTPRSRQPGYLFWSSASDTVIPCHRESMGAQPIPMTTKFLRCLHHHIVIRDRSHPRYISVERELHAKSKNVTTPGMLQSHRCGLDLLAAEHLETNISWYPTGTNNIDPAPTPVPSQEMCFSTAVATILSLVVAPSALAGQYSCSSAHGYHLTHAKSLSAAKFRPLTSSPAKTVDVTLLRPSAAFNMSSSRLRGSDGKRLVHRFVNGLFCSPNICFVLQRWAYVWDDGRMDYNESRKENATDGHKCFDPTPAESH